MRPALLVVDPDAPDPAVIGQAAGVLSRGGLVAFPTETVYGLGADARNADAVARIFAAKGRPADNPLIVHVPGVAEAAALAAPWTPLAQALADRFWPGPLTLVLRAAHGLAPAVGAGLDTVALRVPAHPVALGLLHAAGVPVAAPSANRSGRPSPTRANHVFDDLQDAVDVVVDGGPCTVGVESTVVDARGDQPVVLREGGVTREALAAVATPAQARQTDLRPSPGTRHAHYQPACAVVVSEPGQGAQDAARLAREGKRVGLAAPEPAPENVHELGPVNDASALAERLYDLLRRAEALGLEVVVVEAVTEAGIGRAVMDRLRRAAGA